MKNMLSQFTKEELQKLAAAQSAEELQGIVNKGNSSTLTAEESAELFAALAPIRGKEPLSEEDLELVSGGFTPRSQSIPVDLSKSRL